ncbi:chemotaxis-specific protein-glutamate methyltransferase CheB [Noviherbaspirillum denitrificans]|uniref:protein-glutamate methylesterase n=1 Tax=Noviherbaspirillum denitrificans TaxID=1968433 RepID=A0A254TEC6_9BURK|nr:chemotaxis-specific protein-glutamate methyltransferase CheB [Noviherbaspirillum denitrificans]OWW20507.1 chemotaxis response regulator protein-glutamate methylesterase [Noviherbaspirillum denitrificans]
MKIAIVNDVLLITEALRRTIANTLEHEVIWTAQSGEQAIQFCAANRPDLILMDLIMPGMDGVEAIRQIMQQSPCAILVVTASPDDNTGMVFRALGAGALDVAATPVLAGRAGSDAALLAKVKTIGRLIAADASGSVHAAKLAFDASVPASTQEAETLVAIGASTGGPVALAAILRAWKPPSNTAAVIVQHIDQAFTDSFSHWLASQIDFPIDVIEDGSQLQPGRILVAKTNDHLVLSGTHRLGYSAKPAHYPYRPSIDVFFRCIAQHWHKNAIGILMTGMGRDGASGLLAMRKAGKLTIAQDQHSSAVYGMPRAAAEMDAAELVLPLDRIAPALQARTRKKSG